MTRHTRFRPAPFGPAPSGTAIVRRWMQRVLIALGIALAASSAAAEDGRGPAEAGVAAPVALKPDITVESDTVVLGDLFTGLGERAGTPVARSPAPGEAVRLPADWLGRVARAYDVDWRPVSRMQEAQLRRAAQRIDARRIAAAVAARLIERGADGDLSVRLDNAGIALTLPTGVPGELEVGALRYDPQSGRFAANVMAPSAQRPLASATVSGEALQMVEVPVPNRRIRRGETISDADLVWKRVAADRLKRNHVVAAENLVGQSARRGLQPDRPVRDTDVRAPVLVGKNSLVTLELTTERMRLTAQGRALQDGAAGEVIRVVNTKSNTTVTGVVVADGTVSVAPNAGQGRYARN
jgi:flagella basal body P-ring formation protein FlgA